MNPVDQDQLHDLIREAVTEAIRETSSVAQEEHAEHHRYLRTIIEREELRSQMYRTITANLIGWVGIGFLTFLGLALTEYGRKLFRG